LYSAKYTATRVMKLNEDSIEDWCGEESSPSGFCPAEYYVPKYNTFHYESCGEIYIFDNSIEDDEFIKEQRTPEFRRVQYCDFGFMSGCVWGDDSNWKLKYIDLSRVPDKILTITDKFGYFELPEGSLKTHINMDNWEPDHSWISISSIVHFDLSKDK